MNQKIIDDIVWWIPFKKLRNLLREYLYYTKYSIDLLKEEISNINCNIDDLKKTNEQKFKEYLNKTGYSRIVPIGHYESPYPLEEELLKGFDKIYDGTSFMYNMYAINMNDEIQLEFYKNISQFFVNFDFSEDKDNINRYYYKNGWYGYGCAIYLYSVINYIKPKNIIEIGSGFSTALMLDINNKIFNNSINLLSIEPRPDRLKSLLLETDNIKLIEKNQEYVPLDIFKSLKENDILFIDSSHVCKPFGDINRQFFEILPNLNKGVIVHIHDIPYPDYPKIWIYEERRAYTEAYMLRAFLQYNDTFEILCFPNYLKTKYSDIVKYDGGAIYLRKVK